MAEDDPMADEQYHLGVGPGDVAPSVLLPGDPERLETIVETWDEHAHVASHREYRTATGTVDDVPVSVTSTGIGSPSAAIALEELARVGADTAIRVGSCGAIRPEIGVGDLIIVSGAVRQEGTSKEYVRPEYPAVADHAVVSALVAAAEDLGHTYHVGYTCSTDSFYAGQSRPGFGGFEAAGSAERLEALKEAGVACFEMEASAIFALAGLYGLRAGAVCAVFANRETGEFRTEGEAAAAAVASRAVALLSAMDERVAESGAECWHAGLSL